MPVMSRVLPELIVRGLFVDLALPARQRIHHQLAQPPTVPWVRS
jgi:hypothetical protein